MKEFKYLGSTTLAGGKMEVEVCHKLREGAKDEGKFQLPVEQERYFKCC